MTGMKLLRQFPKGSILFAQAGSAGSVKALGPAPWDVEIWYDSPVANGQPESVPEMDLHVAAGVVEQLDMAFPGHVAGIPACVLVDSGANRCFVDRAFVVEHKLPSGGCWRGGGGYRSQAKHLSGL